MDAVIQMKVISRCSYSMCKSYYKDFLEWSKNAGNDLITPHPEFDFPGLKDGDCWCVCAQTLMLNL